MALSGGTPLNRWSGGPNGTVLAVAASSRALYVGGRFTGHGGEVRNNAAAINLQTRAVTPWDPDVDGFP